MMINELNYVDMAEEVVKTKLKKDARNPQQNVLTTNQIRNVLELMNELYDMVRTSPEEELSEKVLTHIQYIRMKLVYAEARDATVKDLMEKSGLIEEVKAIGKSRKRLILVCRYTEALVAFHKFYPHVDEK